MLYVLELNSNGRLKECEILSFNISNHHISTTAMLNHEGIPTHKITGLFDYVILQRHMAN